MRNIKLNKLALYMVILVVSGCGNNDKAVEVNKAPTAEDATIITQTEVEINEMLIATDPNGDKLIFLVNSEPSLGSVVISSTGNYTYTPNTGVTGSDSFTFIVQDPLNESSTGTVSITIEALDVDFIEFTNNAFSQTSDTAPLTVNGRTYFNDSEESNFDHLLVQ
jgi:hypothetical protein